MDISRELVEVRYNMFVDNDNCPEDFIDFYLEMFISGNEHCVKCGDYYDQYSDLNFNIDNFNNNKNKHTR